MPFYVIYNKKTKVIKQWLNCEPEGIAGTRIAEDEDIVPVVPTDAMPILDRTEKIINLRTGAVKEGKTNTEGDPIVQS